MLLSDRDIRAELAAGRVGLDPFDEAMIQPSSMDVRLDRMFRVFENHRYPHIDPAVEQPDLTRLIEPEGAPTSLTLEFTEAGHPQLAPATSACTTAALSPY